VGLVIVLMVFTSGHEPGESDVAGLAAVDPLQLRFVSYECYIDR
jgi:hypothetical protein